MDPDASQNINGQSYQTDGDSLQLPATPTVSELFNMYNNSFYKLLFF